MNGLSTVRIYELENLVKPKRFKFNKKNPENELKKTESPKIVEDNIRVENLKQEKNT